MRLLNKIDKTVDLVDFFDEDTKPSSCWNVKLNKEKKCIEFMIDKDVKYSHFYKTEPILSKTFFDETIAMLKNNSLDELKKYLKGAFKK